MSLLTNAVNGIVAANGLTFETACLVILVILALLFTVQDYRIGLMAWFIGSLALFVFLFNFNLDYTLSLYSVFISLICMAFSIFLAREGGRIAG
jgi:hypothetical protein